jgi:hypothetical protein
LECGRNCGTGRESIVVDEEPQFIAAAVSFRFLRIASNLPTPSPELAAEESLDFSFVFSFSVIFDWECPGHFNDDWKCFDYVYSGVRAQPKHKQ